MNYDSCHYEPSPIMMGIKAFTVWKILIKSLYAGIIKFYYIFLKFFKKLFFIVFLCVLVIPSRYLEIFFYTEYYFDLKRTHTSLQKIKLK